MNRELIFVSDKYYIIIFLIEHYKCGGIYRDGTLLQIMRNLQGWNIITHYEELTGMEHYTL